MKRNKKILAIALLITLAITTACQNNNSNKADQASSVSDSSQKGNKDNNESESKEKKKEKEKKLQNYWYEQLFDLDKKVEISVNISQEELNKLQNDYKNYSSKGSKSPIYRIADSVTFSVDGSTYTINEVGIRLKGNTSRVPLYNDDGSLNLCHYRLSFNETFDDPKYYGASAKKYPSDKEREERKNRTFATLNGLEIKWNKNFDSSQIREIYALKMFKEFDLLAQSANVSALSMNNKNYGLVHIYEPVDKTFLKRYLGKDNNDGDLYKCAWTGEPASYVQGRVSYGINNEDTSTFYNYDLKTNKQTSKHDDLKNLLSTLSSSSITSEDFASVIDPDYLVKYLAVCYFTGNPDDMRNNYNNHFVYFDQNTGKAYFIPYDYDRCFGVTRDWNPDGTGMSKVSPFSNRADGHGHHQQNPIIIKSVMENGFLIDEYKKALEKVSNSIYLSETKFETDYNKVCANYAKLIRPDVNFNNAHSTFAFSIDESTVDTGNMSYHEYIAKKMSTYTRYANR